MLVLCGCSAKSYTPVINTEFETNAVYKTGDYSFICKIIKTKDSVTVIPTNTKAKGLMITYDGKIVTFKKDKMEKSFEGKLLDNTNPAMLIYNVFSYLEIAEDIEVKKVENEFQYTGKTPLGDFVLIQSNNNTLKSLSVPMADIYIEFEK